MSDPTNDLTPLMGFLKEAREAYIAQSELPMVEAAQEFDTYMRPMADARAREIHQAQVADMPSRAEMLMELVLEVEQVVALVPPRLRGYRELLAAEGLDKTVVAPAKVGLQSGQEEPAEGGREGMPGINLADQAALEFHSQLLQLSFAIAQDEVNQRMEKRSQGGGSL